MNLKAHQDEKLPKENHYIRRVLAIDQAYSAEDAEDDIVPQAAKDDCLRIIICMTPESSRRLLSSGRYLQSDIAFRRIVGFKEFEVAGMERDANTSTFFILHSLLLPNHDTTYLGIIYLRVFVNRMTAAAHERIFEEVDNIVHEDTGKHLKWHHLHASSPEDGLDSMILSWVGDQHRGQAKGKREVLMSYKIVEFSTGLGLHLQKVASRMPPKQDLYQPDRYIQDLTPYDHLHRNFRVCVVHYFRLVKLCATSDQVRWLMRSLVCMEHPEWDATLQMIRKTGGKAAQGNGVVTCPPNLRFRLTSIRLAAEQALEWVCFRRDLLAKEFHAAGDLGSRR